jgi:hypothetical protein
MVVRHGRPAAVLRSAPALSAGRRSTPTLACTDKAMKRKRTLTAAGLSVVLALLLAPWGLYGLGLHGVDGRPSLPTPVSLETQQKVWAEARGIGTPRVGLLNPYTYFSVATDKGRDRPGYLIAWWVASEYVRDHQRYRGMGWWHLSGAALTIWLTRHWTIEQLLSKSAGARGAG